MDFVKEKIPQKCIEKMDWAPFQVRLDGFIRPLGFDTWAINHETNTFLVHVRALSKDRLPQIFVFSWKQTPIRLFADIDIVSAPEQEKQDVFWNIRLALPEIFQCEEGEIIASLRSAIETLGSRGHNRDWYRIFQINIEVTGYIK